MFFDIRYAPLTNHPPLHALASVFMPSPIGSKPAPLLRVNARIVAALVMRLHGLCIALGVLVVIMFVSCSSGLRSPRTASHTTVRK
jgi:hypothetical protein